MCWNQMDYIISFDLGECKLYGGKIVQVVQFQIMYLAIPTYTYKPMYTW